MPMNVTEPAIRTTVMSARNEGLGDMNRGVEVAPALSACGLPAPVFHVYRVYF